MNQPVGIHDVTISNCTKELYDTRTMNSCTVKKTKWYISHSGIDYSKQLIEIHRHVQWIIRHMDDPEWYLVPISNALFYSNPELKQTLTEEDFYLVSPCEYEVIDETDLKYDPIYVCELPSLYNVLYHQMVYLAKQGNIKCLDSINRKRRYVLDAYILWCRLIPGLPNCTLLRDLSQSYPWALHITNIPEIIDYAYSLRSRLLK